MKHLLRLNLFIIVLALSSYSKAQNNANDTALVRNHFIKKEVMIPMRDGVRLFTSIYIPMEASPTNRYPVLMQRTPYSCYPYGEDNYPKDGIGPNRALMTEGYIIVYQDVRGRYKSEGVFEEMTPHKPNKKSKKDVDESTDTYDTVDWLLKNLPQMSASVGIWGISYPGFYATAALIDAHPAIKAVSPQAPVTDEFIGDDVNHNGAFFLLDNFSFMNYFGGERIDSGTNYTSATLNRFTDAYQFYLKTGNIKNLNSDALFGNRVKIWNEYVQHDTYDDYWKARNIRTHLKNIKPAVLVTGGWFDAEDLFGALRTFETVDKNSKSPVHLVMGPWTHGAWSRREWKKFGTYEFGENLNQHYQDAETKFFNFYLKGKGQDELKKTTMFNTGNGKWSQYDVWPPAETAYTDMFFHAGGLLNDKPSLEATSDQYVSDPNKPVPYTNTIGSRRNDEYMVEDQRWAAQRPDVLTYTSDVLTKDLTLAGPVKTELMVTLNKLLGKDANGLDADFVVKLIDVMPDDMRSVRGGPVMANLQRLVRAEVFRGKFRNSFEKPVPFVAGKPTAVKFDLNDVLHTFRAGHRIMIQVQSSWFPLVDRNPQQFMYIPNAEPKDFQPLLISLQHNGSKISLPVLK